MKRVVLVSTAFVLATFVAAAQASDGGNFFIEGSAGQANYRSADSGNGYLYHYSVDKKDPAYALRVGYRWHGVVDYGVEVGYADIGKLKSTTFRSSQYYDDFTEKYHQKMGSRGYLLGGNLKYNLHDWYVSARAGWYRSRVLQAYYDDDHVDSPDHGGRGHYHSTGIGEYAGLGIGYNFTRSFSFGLNYDNYHSREKYSEKPGVVTSFNTAVYSLSAEYRF